MVRHNIILGVELDFHHEKNITLNNNQTITMIGDLRTSFFCIDSYESNLMVVGTHCAADKVFLIHNLYNSASTVFNTNGKVNVALYDTNNVVIQNLSGRNFTISYSYFGIRGY